MTDTVKEKRKSTKKVKAEETAVSTASEDLFQTQASADEVQEQAVSKQEEQPSEPVPERVCDMMRRVRLEKRLDLNDASAYLCIRAQFLRAIEDGNLKELPGETYASGFIRSYASFLGLDPNKTDRLYREEMLASAKEKTHPVSEEEIEKAAPDNKIIILSLVLLIVLSIAWKFYSNSVQEVPVAQTQTREEAFEPENPYPFDNVTTKQESYVAPQDKEPDAVPPVPPRKPAVPEEKPAAVSEKTKTMAEQSAVSDVSVEEKERENKPEAVDAVKRDPVDVKTEKPAETVPVAQETVAPKPYVPKIFGIKNVDARIVLRAKEETWIEVTRGDEVLLTRTLYAGDRYRVPVDSKDLYLKTGNAGGLDVFVDGTLVPSLGKRGSTKSKIALDADSFLVNVSEED